MSITFTEYQTGTAKTAIYPGSSDASSIEGLSYVVMGLGGEAGEILNKTKKIIRDSGGVITGEHRVVLADELGDVLWYASQLATQLGFPLDYIARSNLAKLSDRAQRGVLQGSGDAR